MKIEEDDGMMFKVGNLVEYDPWYASGPVIGVITRIVGRRVYVEIEYTVGREKIRDRGEVFFEPDEIDRLRLVH